MSTISENSKTTTSAKLPLFLESSVCTLSKICRQPDCNRSSASVLYLSSFSGCSRRKVDFNCLLFNFCPVLFGWLWLVDRSLQRRERYGDRVVSGIPIRRVWFIGYPLPAEDGAIRRCVCSVNDLQFGSDYVNCNVTLARCGMGFNGVCCTDKSHRELVKKTENKYTHKKKNAAEMIILVLLHSIVVFVH